MRVEPPVAVKIQTAEQLAPTERTEAEIYWRHAWDLAGERYRQLLPEQLAGERQIARELLFCLLGGHGVTYELNRSAADQMWDAGVFRGGQVVTRRQLAKALSAESFEPRRRDGSLRRYRFPVRKGELLFKAQRWYLEHAPLGKTLSALECEKKRRRLLCGCPGLGPKSASWLLRNCGFASNLAVLDIHVVRALIQAGRIEKAHLPRDYDAAEQAYLDWCSEVGSDPAGFDLLLWDFSRTSST